MNRRNFLTTLTGATIIGSGCATPFRLSGPVSIDAPSVENPDPGEYYYDFADEGDSVGNVDVTIIPRSNPSERATIFISVTPESGWETTMFKFGLLAPATSAPGEPEARVLLKIPDAGRFPPFSLWDTYRGYKMVEVSGLSEAELGDGTIPFQLAIVPRSAVETLSLRLTARWRGSNNGLVEASVTDKLSMPIKEQEDVQR